MSQDFWRLPKGVDEILPPRARHLELLRRSVLDLFDVWGYDFIEPPIIEYLDALLVGNDLNLQTLQVADQVSGRTLGVRADITSQAARIDSNSLSSAGAESTTRRLCYAGAVVMANPTGVFESRVPLKAGAEIYGCDSVEADLEIMCLAIDALKIAGVDDIVIELGHVGFVDQLVNELDFSTHAKDRLFEAVRIKSEADILLIFEKERLRLNKQGIHSGAQADGYQIAAQRLCELVRLMGDKTALESARTLFTHEPRLLELVDQLDYCAARLGEMRTSVVVRFDLSAPVGYGYHHALVFALFGPGLGRAVARGGRYDGIGEQFGDARPATGFDVNLKTLLGLPAVAQRADSAEVARAVWVSKGASSATTAGLPEAIDELRAQGVRVMQALSEDDVRPEDCDQELRLTGGKWKLMADRDNG